jgi:Uma2 family endonuclease
VEVYRSGQTSPVQVLQKGQELSGEEVIPSFSLSVTDLFEYE